MGLEGLFLISLSKLSLSAKLFSISINYPWFVEIRQAKRKTLWIFIFYYFFAFPYLSSSISISALSCHFPAKSASAARLDINAPSQQSQLSDAARFVVAF